MIRNYLLIAFRNIFRNKLFSVVNLLGLAFGIASSLFIFLWVAEEMSYDKFHEHHERLYRVMENQHYADGQIYTFAATPGPMAPFIQDKYPEIERASRFTWPITSLFQHGTTSFYESGHYVDPQFLEMFSFPFVQGDPSTALRAKNNIVITREFAEKLFGKEDAMGKVLVVNDEDNVTVTGIIGEVPANSSIQFSYLLPFQFFWDENASWIQTWQSNNVRTFLQLTEDADPAAFSEKLRHEVKEHNENTSVQLFIQPVDDMYLYSQFENGVATGGRIEQVRIFSIVALFVLLIACINFMNLSTAQAMRRAKEVGLRKVIGAVPGQLFRQFMGESFLMVLMATAIAALLCFLLIPVYNSVTGKELELSLITGRIALLMGGLIVVTGFIAGSYPALYISRFRPVAIIRDRREGDTGASLFRRLLVVVQFSLSIILIIGTIVVFRQMNFMKNKDIGFDRENVFYARMSGDIEPHFETFRERLLREPGIEAVTAASQVPIAVGNSTSGVDWPGKQPDQDILFSEMGVDPGFIEAMGMEIVEGRDFDRSRVADSTNFIVNEAAAVKFGFTDGTAGKSIKVGDQEGAIVGVVKNFNFGSLHVAVDPLILHQNWYNILLVRTAEGQTERALRAFDGLWKEYAAGYPLSYTFLNQEWEGYYRAEAQRGRVFNTLAVLSVFISCLGLFGLSSFSAQRRTKELGIRKVLGASVPGLIRLMGTEFSTLVIIAALVGCPVGWYLMTRWLEQYAYHVDVGVGPLLVAAVVSFVVALVTVAYHSVEVALSDPVKSLRYE